MSKSHRSSDQSKYIDAEYFIVSDVDIIVKKDLNNAFNLIITEADNGYIYENTKMTIDQLVMEYNFSLLKNGELDPSIGLWSIHVMFILFLLIFYQLRQGKVSYFIDKIAFFKQIEKYNV